MESNYELFSSKPTLFLPTKAFPNQEMAESEPMLTASAPRLQPFVVGYYRRIQHEMLPGWGLPNAAVASPQTDDDTDWLAAWLVETGGV